MTDKYRNLYQMNRKWRCENSTYYLEFSSYPMKDKHRKTLTCEFILYGRKCHVESTFPFYDNEEFDLKRIKREVVAMSEYLDYSGVEL